MVAQTVLQEIAAEAERCTACRLHRSRTRAVPGEGPPEAAIFLIGEAPGRKEDEAGLPFVGMAGRVLEDALAEAGVRRSEAFITNTVKCRPPNNRNPRADEMRACRPYLLRQIACTHPSTIVTLGVVALRSLLGGGTIRDLREEQLWFQGIPVVATYHPAATRYSRVLRTKLVEDLRRASDITR